MFAIIQTGGKQYKAQKGDKIEVEKLEAKDGDTIKITEVLLTNDGKETKVGTPFVKGATVSAKVIGVEKADKVRIFKMKAKKRYHITQGHRQKHTVLEITDIKA